MPFDPNFDPRPRRRIRRLPLFLLLVPLLTGFFAAPAAPVVRGDELADAQAQQKALEQRIAGQKAQIAALKAAQAELAGQISSTQTQLRGIAADLSVVRAKVAKLVTEINQVQARYDDLVAQISDMDGQLVTITAQQTQKKSDLAARRGQLADRIRDAYEADRTSMLETVLSSHNFSDVLQEMSYQLDVAEQDKALAQQIDEDRRTLAELEQTIALTRQQTNLLRQEAAVQKIQLDARLAELKVTQAQLKKLEQQTKQALATQRAEFQQVQRNRANLAKAMREAAAAKRKVSAKIHHLIEQQLNRGNIPSHYNGTLDWPMGGAVSQDFGCTGVIWEPPMGSCDHYHAGIDVVSPCNTPVKSAGPGRIVYIDWNFADGPDPAWLVVVAHSSGLQTWYAHMAPRFPGGIHVGSAVKAGQVIGYEASTGHSTGCHLHWAVMLDGSFVNPRLFV
ncbi:MAG: murein hydrolase activator EnvC family protein [Chloroflexota bacterium]